MTEGHSELTRVGVIVVHGIGEQRRFEHVDGQVRALLASLQTRAGLRVTTEIRSGNTAPFEAADDTWDAKHPVAVHVYEVETGRRTVIEFHEVWWADVNEPYSLAKQVRFWLWTLAIWLYPGKRGSTLEQAVHVTAPVTDGRIGQLKEAWIRTRLFGVSVVAVAAAGSIGLVSFLAERLFKIRTPDFLRTFVNYVAGVKLYNQKVRMGVGFPAKPMDFLDTVGEPPRVSVRRRMVRTLMAMAQEGYSRWYVLAHSLGSVVAFNGLMETSYSWPGYFDEASWQSACDAPGPRGPFAGRPRRQWKAGGDTVPQRPAWLAGRDDVAYRSRIFYNLHGVVTFGCPLEKFAAVWPARVPVTKEPAFRSGTQWFNVYDPTDPVSGVLKSFDASNIHRCPRPVNLGFAAGPVLLWSHMQYLRVSKQRSGLADAIAEWVLTGNSAQIARGGTEWFSPGSPRHWRRSASAWVMWGIAMLVLCVAGGVILPLAYAPVRATVCAAERKLAALEVPGVKEWQCSKDPGERSR